MNHNQIEVCVCGHTKADHSPQFGCEAKPQDIYQGNCPCFLDAFLGITHYDHDQIMNNFIDTAVMMKAKKMNEDRDWNETYLQYAQRIMKQKVFGLKFNLGTCCEELEIPNDGQHRAMSDVKLTNEVYKKICL